MKSPMTHLSECLDTISPLSLSGTPSIAADDDEMFDVDGIRIGVTFNEARSVGSKLGVDWSTREFSIKQFRYGMIVELEHGNIDRNTNITNDDLMMTGKIALAHLREYPDYYYRLHIMEQEAKRDKQSGIRVGY